PAVDAGPERPLGPVPVAAGVAVAIGVVAVGGVPVRVVAVGGVSIRVVAVGAVPVVVPADRGPPDVVRPVGPDVGVADVSNSPGTGIGRRQEDEQGRGGRGQEHVPQHGWTPCGWGYLPFRAVLVCRFMRTSLMSGSGFPSSVRSVTAQVIVSAST